VDYTKPKLQQTHLNLDYGCWAGNADNGPASCGHGGVGPGAMGCQGGSAN
jgi:hypothetical protein